MTTKASVTPVNILDTFPAFEKYWSQYKDSPIGAQINAWVSDYMRNWPKLFTKQTRQYKSEGVDWRAVAKKRVFPHLKDRLPSMQRARKALLLECAKVIRIAQKSANHSFPIEVVIYVGIGLGAGWATTYVGKPALLFGLENIAEEGWTDRSEIIGLVNHELGHLYHSFWRERAGMRFGSGPLWDLYTEGFADRFEHLTQRNGNSHLAKDSEVEEWFDWCQENRQWLASEFLRRLGSKGDTRAFFGSWYELRGHSQTGYFIGSELVGQLERSYSLKEIATLDNVSKRIKALVMDMARGSL